MPSDEPTDGRCNEQLDDGYCRNWPVTNDDGEAIDGKCHAHTDDDRFDGPGAEEGNQRGGSHEGNDKAVGHGAPEGNDNAVGHGAKEGNDNALKHGAYAEQSKLYKAVFTDAERELADEIYTDYRDRYESEHGDVPKGHDLRLFKIAVNAVTEIRVDNWATDRPREAESGTPFVDKEETTKFSPDGHAVDDVTFNKSAAVAAKKTLSNDNRRWLKELRLLEPNQVEVQHSGDVGGGSGEVTINHVSAEELLDDEPEE